MVRLYLQIVFLSMLLVFGSGAWADAYDPLLLRAQASIFPKIILLDKLLDQKTPNNEVVLIIVSESEKNDAELQLKSLIEEKYKSSLGNKKLTVKVFSIKDSINEPIATAYIVLQSSESVFNQVVSQAASQDRIVFSHSYTDFKHNALISLLVKEKTYIYLNKSAVQLYDIKFSPVFYKITKIIE